MNIVILGPQGSGKGTQTALLAEKYNLAHIETGKILREIANSNHPRSEEIKNIMNNGLLVSDKILEEVMVGAMDNQKDKAGFVFDGTPRNLEQYNLIKKILEERGESLDKVIVVNISEDESIKRLSARRSCSVCGKVYNIITNPSPNGDFCECGGRLFQREDDRPQLIKKRLQTYHEQTSKVIELAKNDGILEEINGERPIEEIFNNIVKSIEIINGKN
jgi:adenylate kinase